MPLYSDLWTSEVFCDAIVLLGTSSSRCRLLNSHHRGSLHLSHGLLLLSERERESRPARYLLRDLKERRREASWETRGQERIVTCPGLWGLRCGGEVCFRSYKIVVGAVAFLRVGDAGPAL